VGTTHAAQPRRAGLVALLAAAVAALALLAFTTPSAEPGEILSPAVVLGPITVANGTATISGNIGVPNSNVQLSINGQPLSVDAAGNFSGAINLDGQSRLTLTLTNSAGEITSVTIPLNTNVVGPGGVIGPEILDALKKAGVSILKPLEGFKILDQLPLKIEGSVLDKGSLASLTVNGKDVLSLLGQDRIFTVLLPGTTKEVTVTATDTQGVSQTSTAPVLHAASMFTTPVGRSVAATGALGVRIAKIRYVTKNVRRTKRMRMIVTIKDRRGLLVRGATVRVTSRYVRRIARNPRAKKTNRVGQAAFLLKATKRTFGKRLVMITVAKTPASKASKRSSVRIPNLKRAVARRR
jgi:hypothetical protein